MFEKNKLISEIHAMLKTFGITKVVIWGHKWNHTHHHIHAAFYKFFKYINIETYWFNDNENIANFNCENCLFLTEGQVDKNIPVNMNSYYILHNCDLNKYKDVFLKKHAMIIQVFTKPVLSRNCLMFNNLKCHYYNTDDVVLYLPWATNLTPEEIQTNIDSFDKTKMQDRGVFVGSVWSDWSNPDFGNTNQIATFRMCCQHHNIPFECIEGLSIEKNVETIRGSKYSPSIQGKWQCDNSYIPCRILKNISYGSIGITNSEDVYNFLEQKVVFNKDVSKLVEDTNIYLNSHENVFFKELMNDVKNNHTYLNRIHSYLSFLTQINENNVVPHFCQT